jgi:predicted kinase
VIVVNGLPGVGKTTIAQPLARALHAVLLSKDSIKEALGATAVDPTSSLGAVAMETIWALARAHPGTVLIDTFLYWPRDLDHLRAGLRAAGARRVVEVWCHAHSSVVRERYASRRRHPVHEDAKRLMADWDRWAVDAQPLAIGPVVAVDTTTQVDIRAVASQVERTLAAG